MGVTRLRLARFGSRNRPFYRVVAIDSRKARDSKPIEYLGTYDPYPSPIDGVKEVRLTIDRIKYWLAVGAQPSDRVAYLLWRAGLVPPPPIHYTPNRSKPKGKEEGSSSSGTAAPPAPAKTPAAAAAKKYHTLTHSQYNESSLSSSTTSKLTNPYIKYIIGQRGGNLFSTLFLRVG